VVEIDSAYHVLGQQELRIQVLNTHLNYMSRLQDSLVRNIYHCKSDLDTAFQIIDRERYAKNVLAARLANTKDGKAKAEEEGTKKFWNGFKWGSGSTGAALLLLLLLL
jgi:hypothetical protein